MRRADRLFDIIQILRLARTPTTAAAIAAELEVTPGPEIQALYARFLSQRSNLPAPMTALIGRQRELATILDLLAAGRLVTLLGVGGCGKTRLALAAATEALPSFADGVWLADLAPLRDPGAVPPAVAAALWFALDTALPVIVDADGLTILAAHPDFLERRANRGAPNYRAALSGDLKGLRIGLIRHFYERDNEANAATRAAIWRIDRP